MRMKKEEMRGKCFSYRAEYEEEDEMSISSSGFSFFHCLLPTVLWMKLEEEECIFFMNDQRNEGREASFDLLVVALLVSVSFQLFLSLLSSSKE